MAFATKDPRDLHLGRDLQSYEHAMLYVGMIYEKHPPLSPRAWAVVAKILTSDKTSLFDLRLRLRCHPRCAVVLPRVVELLLMSPTSS